MLDNVQIQRYDLKLVIMYLENPDMIPKSYVELPNLIERLKNRLTQ